MAINSVSELLNTPTNYFLFHLDSKSSIKSIPTKHIICPLQQNDQRDTK